MGMWRVRHKWVTNEEQQNMKFFSNMFRIISHSETPRPPHSLCVLTYSVTPTLFKPARLLCPWGFSRQECWNGLPCPPPGDLPYSGTEPRSPALQEEVFLPFFLFFFLFLVFSFFFFYHLSYQGSPCAFYLMPKSESKTQWFHSYFGLTLSDIGLPPSPEVWCL